MTEEKPIEGMTFEEALDALSRIVEELEQGEVPLDRSIALYERGGALKAHCERKLKEAELKVERIAAGADGSLTAAPDPDLGAAAAPAPAPAPASPTKSDDIPF